MVGWGRGDKFFLGIGFYLNAKHFMSPLSFGRAFSLALFGGRGSFFITMGSVVYFHYGLNQVMYVGVLVVMVIMFVWWQDVIRESTFQGYHSLVVKQGIRYGMLLFILSEVLFFFSFFWAFFS